MAAARKQLLGDASEADLRRAVSTGYYALFHLIATTVANSLVTARLDPLSKQAWELAYRGVDHASLRAASRHPALLRLATPAIAKFADVVLTMQAKRHVADYAAYCEFTATEVADDLDQCEAAILAFATAPEAECRAFIAFILFKTR